MKETEDSLEISTYIVWRMRMKFPHMFEQLIQNILSNGIELDEKYYKGVI